MDMSHMDNEATCPMIMVFHGGHCERILWRGWVASTVLQFVLACIAWFCIAFTYEAVKFVRQYLRKRSLQKATERATVEIEARCVASAQASGCPHASPVPLPEKQVITHGPRIFTADHIIQSLLNVVQVVISYLLMLVVMTFNYWLCLSVALGISFGYFCFGWFEQQHNTITDGECCS